MNKDEKKELIRLAAKAAGHEVILPEDAADREFHLGKEYNFKVWNPIDDDADAFKLAVKLEFDVQQDTDNVLVWFWTDEALGDAEVLTVDVGDDRLAATREAITTAAAVIGKNK